MSGQPILVGVDGAPESAAAARAGWLLAQALGVDCRLGHATRAVRSAEAMAGAGVSLDALGLAMLARARMEVLEALGDTVPASVTQALIVRPGRTEAVLSDLIADTEAQMLVLGGKHHSTLGRSSETVPHALTRVPRPARRRRD